MDGESARSECLFGRIALLRADIDGAYARYNRAFELGPGDTEAQLGLGRLLETKEKPAEALKYLRMAVQSDPLNDEAHYRLASVCKKLQLKDESAKEFRLFQEIKQAKERMEGLYTQMNRKPPGQEDKLPDVEP
jgi:tetratricopeptide (TPR) repeat protein